MGLVGEIIEILDSLKIGYLYFETAMLLRNAILINGMINSVEIWYNLTNNEVNELEIVDRILLQQVLGKIPRTVPRESMYLELGIEEINVIIKKRRLIYFQSVIARKKKSMLYNFLMQQWHRPYKGDFTELVKESLQEFGFSENLVYLENTKPEHFKEMIKERSVKLSLKLLREKKEKHSKMKNLQYKNLQMQEYLKDNSTSLETKRMLFKWRTHTENFKLNYKNNHDNLNCEICNSHPDSQQASLTCKGVLHARELLKLKKKMQNI